MFGMVLVIRIVGRRDRGAENVKRIMSEGLSPLRRRDGADLWRHHWRDGADRCFRAPGILRSVGVHLPPVFGGDAIAAFVFLALSLTPALCATLLKPVEAGHQQLERRAFRLV
jgi:multidrug efflux pump